MKRRFPGLLLIGLFAMTLAQPSTAEESESWDFTVYLNDKEIGKHRFEVTDTDGVTRVSSEAMFKYTILRVPVYRYQHSAAERWSDDCLVGLSAQTNANGDRIRVSGERTDGKFTIVSAEAPVELPECVMSFAYWNPDFLEQQRLLNPQTGEYVDIDVEEVGEELLQVRGQQVEARRFRLTAYDVDLTLWYSKDDEWLALESIAKGKHIIRYELS
jgi:hypothetical protein